MRMIAPHTPRWRCVLFDAPDVYIRPLELYLTGPLPSLTHLSIHTQSLDVQVIPHTLALSPPVAPLEHLSLKGIALMWGDAMVRGLKTLSLKNITDANTPSIQQILEMLEMCPELQELRLHRLAPAIESTRTPSSRSKPLPLPHLRTLHMQSVPQDLARAILETCPMDGLTRFVFCGIGNTFQPELLRTLFQGDQVTSSVPLVVMRNNGSPNLRIEVRSSEFVQVTSDATTEAQLHLTLCCEPEAALGHLQACMQAASEVTLNLHIMMEDVTVLDSLPNLTRLTVHDAGTAEAVVDYLSIPRATQGNGWPLPKLKHLHSVEWWEPRLVEQLTKTRLDAKEGLPLLNVMWGPLEM